MILHCKLKNKKFENQNSNPLIFYLFFRLLKIRGVLLMIFWSFYEINCSLVHHKNAYLGF